MTDESVATGPLRGVRVLDLSSVVMGPYATQILGDLGADVICVEAVGGDTNRSMGPGPLPGLSGVSLNLLRNKRNICLDLKQPAGRDACLRLAATCDVVITNLRPGPLHRLGLDYAAIAAVKPDIVMCQSHGWPSDSASADKPAYDDVIQGSSGLADTLALQTGEPALIPSIVADKVSGLTITYAVLAALFHRERTGEGQFIEVPMVDAVSSFTLVEHGSAAIPVPALGAAGYERIVAPERRPFRTADGWICVLPYSLPNYNDLYREGGRGDLVDDDRLLTARSRISNSATLYAELVPIIAMRPTDFWLEFCEHHDIPAGPVRTLDELTAELPVAEHPLAGRYHRIPSPTRFAATPTSVHREAPMLGEHGLEVLSEAGFSAAEVAGLIECAALLKADT